MSKCTPQLVFATEKEQGRKDEKRDEAGSGVSVVTAFTKVGRFLEIKESVLNEKGKEEILNTPMLFLFVIVF